MFNRHKVSYERIELWIIVKWALFIPFLVEQKIIAHLITTSYSHKIWCLRFTVVAKIHLCVCINHNWKKCKRM